MSDTRPHYLVDPDLTPPAQALLDKDVGELGYVMNLSRMWAHQPETNQGLFGLIDATIEAGGLSFRERGILVTACASTLGDSYCSLAWGKKLAAETDPATAASVLLGKDEGLSPGEAAIANWARAITADPNGTDADDVQTLRDHGFSDAKIFAITVFVSLRIAFSTINDALGALPDGAYQSSVPPEVLAAVTYGRPIEPR